MICISNNDMTRYKSLSNLLHLVSPTSKTECHENYMYMIFSKSFSYKTNGNVVLCMKYCEKCLQVNTMGPKENALYTKIYNIYKNTTL